MWTDRRAVPILLGLSLLLNIFLIGLITGHELSRSEMVPRAFRGRPFPWGQTRRLAPGEKKGFGEVMRAHHAAIETKRAALRAAKASLKEAILAPTYDPAKVAAAFAAVRQASDQSQEAVQAALTEALGTLSPEARAKLFPGR